MSHGKSLPKLKGERLSHHAKVDHFAVNDAYTNDIGDKINDIHNKIVPQTCGTEMRIDLNAVLGSRKVGNLASRGLVKKSITQKSVEILNVSRGGVRQNQNLGKNRQESAVMPTNVQHR